MFLKALIGVGIFVATTVAAVGQEEPANQTPRPTLADVQRLAKRFLNADSSFARIAS